MQSVRHYLNEEEQRIEVDGKQAGLKCLTEPPSSNLAGPGDETLEAVVAKANLSDKKVNSDDRFALKGVAVWGKRLMRFKPGSDRWLLFNDDCHSFHRMERKRSEI